MLHPRLPVDATLVQGKDDAGKRVKINSVGGALVDVDGTVLVGPYTYQYMHCYKVTPKKEAKDRYGRERVKYKEEERTSAPNWLVRLDGFGGREIAFIESELEFVK